jgi:hypothetical protein
MGAVPRTGCAATVALSDPAGSPNRRSQAARTRTSRPVSVGWPNPSKTSPSRSANQDDPGSRRLARRGHVHQVQHWRLSLSARGCCLCVRCLAFDAGGHTHMLPPKRPKGTPFGFMTQPACRKSPPCGFWMKSNRGSGSSRTPILGELEQGFGVKSHSDSDPKANRPRIHAEAGSRPPPVRSEPAGPRVPADGDRRDLLTVNRQGWARSSPQCVSAPS